MRANILQRFFATLSVAMLFMFIPTSNSLASSDYYFGNETSGYVQSEHPVEPEHGHAMAVVSESEHHDEEGGHHGPDTSPLFFIILAVFIGAATRHFLKSIPVPFTALLLIIGLVLGVLNRLEIFDVIFGLMDSLINRTFIPMLIGKVEIGRNIGDILASSLKWAAHIDPHMLFFVFLPILIFEAAFAMDLHTFKRSATNSVILAVPGILVALLLTGLLVYGIDYFDIGLEGWANWSLAFMFGSVISATDPVAVVALLKDLGASKKLGTLIEGESLLNDGTAIVLFMVFFTAISGDTSDANGFVEFFRVAFGGTAIGLFVGWIILRWLKGVFNDAMVEISAVVGAAYITFYVAEHFMHVSGVLALVALGLMIGGFGRSSISPQVEHFMHEFWELAGFIANCLIFLIVGIVIAERTHFTLNDFLVLGIVYVGIHVVRAIVMIIHYPFMKNSGYGLPVKDAVVVWYGALRGAIGLALALMVAGVDSDIMARTLDMTPEAATIIKDQFLFIIAGTVTLTLLVNATTIKMLVEKLGLLDIPPVKALALKSTSEYMRVSAESHIQKLKEDRHLRKANWSSVAEYLPKELKMVENLDESTLQVAKIAEYRRRILEKEMSSYWRQFKEGMLGPDALRTLTDTVNDILDDQGLDSLSYRKDLEELWRPAKWLSVLQTWPIIGKVTETAFFEHLAVSYDCAVGFIAAQEDCLQLIDSMFRADGESDSESASLNRLKQEVNENVISGQTFVRNLRNTYPEIYRAISTRQAIRSVLNYELHTVGRLKGKGRLDGGEAAKLTTDIEARMKQLMEKPPSIELPETNELLDSISWAKGLDKDLVKSMAKLCTTKIYSTGQVIQKPGGASQGVSIVARGNVKIMDGKETIELAGKGAMIGQQSLLTSSPNKHGAIAESPVTVLWLSKSNVHRLMQESEQFGAILRRMD